MKTITRTPRNGSANGAAKQAPKQSNNPATPALPWMTLGRLALLTVLAENRSKFNLSFDSLSALARACGVELKPGDDTDLVFMAEMGLVVDEGCNTWSITSAGRQILRGHPPLSRFKTVSSARTVLRQSQIKTPPGNNGVSQSRLPRSSGETSFVLFDGDEKEYARFDLPNEIVALIQGHCSESKTTFDEFIERAVRAELFNEEDRQIYSRASELESAIEQAHALNELLEYRVLHPDEGGSYCDSIQSGLVELGSETFNRLHRASEGAFDQGGAR